jgi:hypothetical protein
MKEVRTVAEVIESLKGYDQNEKIAVQWWMDVDFQGYEDVNQALSLAQTYLDNLNPDITDYVDDLYEEASK